MGEKGGRSLKGIEESGYERIQVTIPPSLSERLEKYLTDEERPRSWVVQKALDQWLKERGY